MMTVDATDREIVNEIKAARDALIAVAKQKPGQQWTAYDLAVRARNGWSSAIVDLALRELIDEGAFQQHQDMTVVFVPQSA